jgi:hypothetical protein
MIVAGGIVMLIRPSLLLNTMSRYASNTWLQVLAVVARLVLGVALLGYAELSRFPHVLQVLGWLAIAAAIFLAVLPRDTFQRMIVRVLDLFSPYFRPGGIVAAAAGMFLMYSVS